MKNITYYSTIISLLFLSSNIYAANIYVDKTLSSNCTSGNYSTSNRNCSGNDGNAYRTIQAAIDAMSPGDHIFMFQDIDTIYHCPAVGNGYCHYTGPLV